jgi:hypothetical protein
VFCCLVLSCCPVFSSLLLFCFVFSNAVFLCLVLAYVACLALHRLVLPYFVFALSSTVIFLPCLGVRIRVRVVSCLVLSSLVFTCLVLCYHILWLMLPILPYIVLRCLALICIALALALSSIILCCSVSELGSSLVSLDLPYPLLFCCVLPLRPSN